MLIGPWQHITETYASLDMLPHDFSLQGFLYNTEESHKYFWFYVNISIVNLLHLKFQFENTGESINNISHQ